MKILRLVVLLAVAVPALVLVAGQLGAFRGTRPEGLGVHGGQLMPPRDTPNSVSSQAPPDASRVLGYDPRIAPLRYTGESAAAMQKLAALLTATQGCVVVTNLPGYIYAQATTPLLKFTDDLEFYLDAPAGVIQVRSASRLGKSDLGTNRARIESLRARFEAGQ